MLPNSYDPKNYGGEIWWNEKNPEMRKLWGTQADYDAHIKAGGCWATYKALRESINSSNAKKKER